MSDYLRQLSDRAFSRSAGIRPHLLSMFEPPIGVERPFALDPAAADPEHESSSDQQVLTAAPARPAGDLRAPVQHLAPRLSEDGGDRTRNQRGREARTYDGGSLEAAHDDGQPVLVRASQVGWVVAANPSPDRPSVQFSAQPRRGGGDAEATVGAGRIVGPTADAERLVLRPFVPPPIDAAILPAETIAATAARRSAGRATTSNGDVAARLESRSRAEEPHTTIATEHTLSRERTIVHQGAAVQPVITPARIPPPQVMPHAGTRTPTIQVTIGRVEVRATQAPAMRPQSQAAMSSAMTLAEYLRQRASGDSR